MNDSSPRYAFFGTPEIACTFLDVLETAGMPPALVVSSPSRPAGRGLARTPPPVAGWAAAHGAPLLQPENIDDAFIEELASRGPWDVFIVVAYGVILPQRLIALPSASTLNVHFSLLPRWRGASPVESAILAGDAETGAAIQIMRPKLDTGPVIAVEKTPIAENETAPALRARLGEIGARLLVDTLPRYLAGELEASEQDDTTATYAKKIKKEDGDITHDDDATRFRKYRAYYEWPGTFFFTRREANSHASASASLRGTQDVLRVKIAAAHEDNGRFIIDRVIPEGKREMEYTDFLRNQSH